MNLDAVRPKSETEDLLLSLTKNCETLLSELKQNHKKHLEINLPNQEKQFISNHQTQLKDFGWYRWQVHKFTNIF